jgi:hypothetical protein
MMARIDCGEFILKFDNSLIIIPESSICDYKGILSIRQYMDSKYYLYKWYDEGHFLDSFDTEYDNNSSSIRRLKITGVDEI